MKGRPTPERKVCVEMKTSLNKKMTAAGALLLLLLALATLPVQAEGNPNDSYTGTTRTITHPVMPDREWTILFSGQLQPDQPYHESIYVRNEAGKKMETRLEISGNRLTVIPAAYYEPDSSYYLYIGSDIASVDGRPVGEARRFMFTTAPHSLEGRRMEEQVKIPTRKVWRVSFSQPVQEESLKPESIYVTDERGKVIPTRLSLAEDLPPHEQNRVVKVEPVERYNYETLYYLFVRNVLSREGEALEQPVWMKFTTGEEYRFEILKEF